MSRSPLVSLARSARRLHGGTAAPCTVLQFGVVDAAAARVAGYDSEPQAVGGLPGDVCLVGAGHHHSLAATEAGEVWAWGRSSEGQAPGGLPAPVPGLPRAPGWRHVAGSGVASAAVDVSGRVWTWGSSKRGALGHGPGALRCEPRLVEGVEGAREVALGWGHALALTEDGAVMFWGYMKSGAGGGANKGTVEEEMVQEAQAMEAATVWEPRRVALPGRALAVACGLDHALALLEDGTVAAWGDTELGQLGPDVATAGDGSEPRVLAFPGGSGATALAAGLGHSVAAAGGGLWSWGWNSGGQLGRPATGAGNLSREPGRVDSIEDQDCARGVSAGRMHTVAVSGEGELLTWGGGSGGRLGHGDSSDRLYPERVEALWEDELEVVYAACGLDHTVVLARPRPLS